MPLILQKTDDIISGGFDMKIFYRLVKYNNGQDHDLDDYSTEAEAIEHAKALHDPDWPCWQGVEVYRMMGLAPQKIFDTAKEI